MQPRLTNPAHTTNIQPEKGINQKIFVSQFSKNTVETHHLRDYPREIDMSANERSKDKMRTWRGTAISVATKANIPRKALFAATAVDDRPTLASTMYAKELE